MARNGCTLSGFQNYRCRCGYTWTDSDHAIGRPPLFDVAMTQSERDARWKEKDPEGYEAARIRKQEKRKSKNKEKINE